MEGVSKWIRVQMVTIKEGGLRGDECEREIRHVNSDLRPDITTAFLIPPRKMSEVSSSQVKGLIGPKGWEAVVRQYVPKVVYRFPLTKYRRDSSMKKIV
jgi:phosphopantetheine adenylyltransferase